MCDLVSPHLCYRFSAVSFRGGRGAAGDPEESGKAVKIKASPEEVTKRMSRPGGSSQLISPLSKQSVYS